MVNQLLGSILAHVNNNFEKALIKNQNSLSFIVCICSQSHEVDTIIITVIYIFTKIEPSTS